MTLPRPNLDDRTFDDLVRESVKLLPRYAPQWNDHNWSDPGITFIDLFSWLTEMTLYRINQVTDRHLLKYLRLLGTIPGQAAPSKVELTFDPAEETEFHKGYCLFTDISGTRIFFELDDDPTIVLTVLKKIIVDEGSSGAFDRTAANDKGDQFFAPFGLSVKNGCALYLGFENPADMLSLFCHLYEEDLINPGSHGDEPDYACSRTQSLSWAYSIGNNVWRPFGPGSPDEITDGTDGFTKNGEIRFSISGSGWSPSVIRFCPDNLAWLRCSVMKADYEYPPRIATLRLNTVTATQGRFIGDGEGWTGTGLPDQVLRLRYTPILYRTLSLEEVGPDGTIPWTEVDDFDGSGPRDNHFALDCRSGEIRFGDGLYGKVPEPGSEIRVIRYRVGGGETGNIGAGKSWKTLKKTDQKEEEIPLRGVRNFHPAAGGTETESVEEAFRRIRRDLNVPYTAVTTADFEEIARRTPGLRVAAARAFVTEAAGCGKPKGPVTVVVVPFTPLETFDSPPAPSEEFLHAVCMHLDRHRLLGTEVCVAAPVYVRISIDVTIVPEEGFAEDSARSRVIRELTDFLHPIKGGRNKKGWPIGMMVSKSELYDRLDELECVSCVIRLTLSGDSNVLIDDDGNLNLPPNGTVYTGKITVTVIRNMPQCRKSGRGYGIR